MRSRMYVLLGVGLLFVFSAPMILARTVVSTMWEFDARCEFGGTEDRIVMTRYYDDGTYETKWLYRKCDDECWHETTWESIGGPPSGPQLPTLAIPAGILLLNAPSFTGGTFHAGSGATCRAFTPSTQTFILIPNLLLS